MALFDLPLDQLRSYRTATTAPPDLSEFWDRTLGSARTAARSPAVIRYEKDLYGAVDAYDVEFSGALGQRVKAWLIVPRAGRPAPLVVHFVGYGGGRGRPADHTFWPAMGFAVLVMDSRGQGGAWTRSDTPDIEPDGAGGAQAPGVVTRGILDRDTYYFTRLWTDAARLVESALEICGYVDGVDASRLGVSGGSQGGGLALAAAALIPWHVQFVHAEHPFMSDVARAVTLVDTAPYRELARFLHLYPEHLDAVNRTLSYVDCAILASRITAPVLMACGLMDDICPPSTAFAAFNAIAAPKRMVTFPFTQHETPPLWPEERARAAHDALRS